MVFSNSVFLFIFLPLVVLGYYLIRCELRNYWLFASSIFFYRWGEPVFVKILLVSIMVNYVCALLVKKVKFKKLMLTIAVLANLGLLFYFKYFNFAVDVFNHIFAKNVQITEVLLPIGISFFTFQGMSYVVDVYREEVSAQKNPFKVGMYIAMFPQLVAGPIVRYSDIVSEIDNRKVDIEDFAYGVQRFIIGLFKKIIIADNMAVIADAIFVEPSGQNSVSMAWLGIIAYTLQIFFDFAGYSDMAIGLGRMFGFHFLENFNYPYISKSITEFWRRWHMSLSSFFRDYVYIPLGGNRKHVYINVAIVFLLTGIWHGAAYTFIFWGIWHGCFNILEKIFTDIKKKNNGVNKSENKNNRLVICIVQHLYTLLVVIIGWVFFRSPSMAYGIDYLKSMIGLNNPEMSAFNVWLYLNKWSISIMFLAFMMCTPICKKFCNKVKEKLHENIWIPIKYVVLLSALILCVLQVASNTYSAFIYFQF